MAAKSYIFVNDYKAPYVQVTGLPHNPQKIRFKKFLKGEIVKGELKHANNKPAFILVAGVCVVPLDIVKELVTKAVVEHNDHAKSAADGAMLALTPKKKPSTASKVKYVDAMVVGALLGVGAVFLADKQGWISMPDKKHKLYGAAIGAAAGLYFVYRMKQNPRIKPNEKTTVE